jgi:pimeloyl-ACP methyl ester carboxylesterase
LTKQVLIIHGWSDTSRSFRPLARFLSEHGYEPKLLWLGDYISKDDDVRVEDVGIRMAEVVDEMMTRGELESSFDVIVHSTGGLVARAWLTTRYRGAAESCPMKRLIMLAPANYGSRLAATGKSLLGRVVKGYDNWFQTGQSMLNDLELASPFQWELAQRDVLIAPGDNSVRYYGEDRVWPFVVVGTHPYTNMLRQVVNEDGSDGTVRVCAANLNACGVTIDFREKDPEKMRTIWESRLECEVPLAVLPTRTHGSIIDPQRGDRDNREKIAETPEEKDELGRLILRALGCAGFGEYRTIQQEWRELSERTAERRSVPPKGSKAEYFHQYLQVNTFVVDDHGKPVADYFLEFFSNTTKEHDEANVYLHAKVLEDVKKNETNAALRNLYFDRTDLMEGYYPLLPEGTAPILHMSISAASPGDNISYFERERIGAEGWVPMHLEAERTKRWLRRNTTHFAKIIIPRIPGSRVFRLTKFEQSD